MVHAPTDAVGLFVLVQAPTELTGFVIPVHPVVTEVDEEKILVSATKSPKGSASVPKTTIEDSAGFGTFVHPILVIPTCNRQCLRGYWLLRGRG